MILLSLTLTYFGIFIGLSFKYGLQNITGDILILMTQAVKYTCNLKREYNTIILLALY